MSVCMMSCAISLVFIIGMVYMNLFVDKVGVAQSFLSTLSEKQREIYGKIVGERKSIYFSGYGIGLVLSLLLVGLFKYGWFEKVGLGGNVGNWGKMGVACFTGAVTFLVSYFYYILSPKSDFMIMHIQGEKQKLAWLKVYRTMQYHYHLGMFLGVVGVALLNAGLC